MQYMLLIHGNENAWESMTEADRAEGFAAYMQFNKDAGEAGVLRGGEQLATVRTAKIVRVTAGKAVNTDGPFAESREQLGGYYLIEVNSEAEALAWAAKCPGSHHGAVEVRAIISHGG